MSASGKFFRPPPTAEGGGTLFDSSEEEEDESSDEEQERQPQQSNKRAHNSSGEEEDDGDEYEDEEEEDEEEDDDDDDDYGTSKKKKKKSKKQKVKEESTPPEPKKKPRASYFDEEAEDAASDEEESVYGDYDDPNDRVLKHYTAEDIARENLDDEAKAIMAQQDRRRMNSSLFDADMSADELAESIRKRHKMSRRVVDRRHLENLENAASEGTMNPTITAVSQQSLVPSVSDPSLWMFSCAPGKESELVYQIMNKCIAYVRQGKPLGITAAIASQSKGRIYIESYSEPAVLEAVNGVRKLLINTKRLVPINDMTTVMSVTTKKKPVKQNDWVRLTRGQYKGDLAIVKAVRDSGLKCVIQCVPRLDLTLADLPPEEAKIRRKTVRPPQKFFNASEIAALGKELYRQRFPGGGAGGEMCDYFEGNYYHDGYLIKELAVGTMLKLCTDEDPPTLDELQKFRKKNKKDDLDDDDEEENEGSKMASSLLDELSNLQGTMNNTLSSSKDGATTGFVIGDTVQVIEGDLIGMRGKLTNIDGATVKMKPSNATDLDENTEVEFLASQVRKYIAVGAHIKIIDGRYVNETGVVVAVDGTADGKDFTAVVLTDMTHKEISVRISQIQESAEVASGFDKLAGYELHDLVVLSGGGSANEVGVITRVGREEFSVINNHGIVRDVRPEELRGKRNTQSQRAVALDVQGNQIRCGDLVTVAEGPNKGKAATIKRMSRAQLFLYSQLKTENSGIFVVRSRSCVLTGNRTEKKKANNTGIVSNSRGGPRGGNNKKDDGLMGKSIRIKSGQWKGYLGVVTDATNTHVQVELHSRLKKVMVTRERVLVVGDKFGSTGDAVENNQNTPNTSIGGMSTPFLGGATPMHGMATPLHGTATPLHGSFTPSHSGSGDVWRPGDSGNEMDTIVKTEDTEVSSSWGVSNNGTDSLFGNSTTNAAEEGGWGSSAGGSNAWGNESSNDGGTKPGESQNSTFNSADDTVLSEDPPPVWFMERVCVQMLSGANMDSSGVIKDTNTSNRTATIELLENNETITVKSKDLKLVQPTEHDMVLVTGGADVGVEGELVCIDGNDAILKDTNEDFKIVDFSHLAKIVNE